MQAKQSQAHPIEQVAPLTPPALTSSYKSEPQTETLAPVLLTLHAVSAYIGFNRPRIYGFIKTDGFPAPLKFGKSSRWLKSQIDSWLASRMEGGAA